MQAVQLEGKSVGLLLPAAACQLVRMLLGPPQRRLQVMLLYLQQMKDPIREQVPQQQWSANSRQKPVIRLLNDPMHVSEGTHVLQDVMHGLVRGHELVSIGDARLLNKKPADLKLTLLEKVLCNDLV